MHQLGISEHVLQSYLNHGDSVLLATLIHFTRQFVCNPPQDFWESNSGRSLLTLLSRLGTNYNVQDTLAGLQPDFCGLWNEIVLQRRDRGHHLLSEILQEIRPIYLALHQGSTQHDPYSLCSIPSHHLHSASNLNEVNDVETVEMTDDPVITSPALVYRDAVSPIIQPVATYDAPISRMLKLDHAIPHPADEPSRYEVPSMLRRSTWVTPSFHPSPLDSERFSDGAVAGPIQGTANHSIVTSMVGPITAISCPHPSGDAIPRH